jgi:hypothetical protein
MRMMHTIIFCLLAVTSHSAFADDAADVRAANSRWTAAMKAKDVAAVEKIVGPEFVLTRGQALGAGERVERAAWIANLKQMTFAAYRADVTGVQVAVGPSPRMAAPGAALSRFGISGSSGPMGGKSFAATNPARLRRSFEFTPDVHFRPIAAIGAGAPIPRLYNSVSDRGVAA